MKKVNKNIVLIGMPGCGKTIIGKNISYKLKKKFIDLDEYIENKVGCSVTKIFQNGEDYFRNLESKAVKEISIETDSIISTGGGVIKRQENIINLKKNGVVIFIDRPIGNIISDVSLENRPLLKDGIWTVERIYRERYNIYKNLCDFRVDNRSSIDIVVEDIITIFNKECDIYD